MRLLTWTVPALVALAGLSPLVVKGDEKKEDPLAAYEKAGKPGPQHKLLQPTVGTWEWTGKCWMEPGAEPMPCKGTAVSTWVLGGRFVRQVIECKGGPFGDFTGISYTGYDNIRKKYSSSWTDSMSTAISIATGEVDKTGKVFTYQRQNLCPLTGETIKGRDVIRIISNDVHVVESYHTMPDGKEVKAMELTCKRVKK